MPYPPGGGTDVIARIVQERSRAALGQPIVIENRGGAAGSLGTDVAAKAAPDGYTVLFTLSSHTINPSIYPKLPFDTVEDFEPVGTVASLPQILVANPQLPANSVAELIAIAKAKPGSAVVRLGRQRVARPPRRRAVQAEHRHEDDAHPYRGGGPAVTDVMGGRCRCCGSRSRPRRSSSSRRAEGPRGLDGQAQRGVPRRADDAGGRHRRLRGRLLVRDVRAGKTPRPMIEKLNAALNTVLNEPGDREKLLAQGSEGVGGTPDAAGQDRQRRAAKWAKLAKDANIKARGRLTAKES